jgi:hypothetical protein
MNRLFVLGATVAASIAVPGTALAQTPAATPIKAPLVNDCGQNSINGDCTALDGAGTFAGLVKSRHNARGNLRLMVVVKAGAASATYNLNVYCGADPAQPGTLAASVPNAVQTDQAGAVVAGPFEVPAADVKAACGSQAVGHIQLVGVAGGSVLTGGPVDMMAG